MDTQPDILWLSLESVRADHTSLYGYHRDTTPNLARLSQRSDAVVLDPAVSASMWTPASTASMLTGTHMSTHQVGRDGKAKKKLPDSVTTLPQLLSDVGYRTTLFSTNPYIGSQTGLDRGFDDTELSTMLKSNFAGVDSLARDSIRCAIRCLLENPTLDVSQLRDEIVHGGNYLLERRVKRWFKDRYRGSDPFFAYAHIPSPHHTYYPVAKFRHEYTDDIALSPARAGSISREVYPGTEGIKRRMATGLDLSDAEWEAIKAMYDAEIKYADYTADRLISIADAASDRPLVVVVVGDHGDLFGEYDLLGHNLVLHDGLVKVPALVVGIDDVVDDQDTVTQHIDLTYTVASIADATSDQLEGRDIRDPSRPYAISQRGIAHFDAYTTYNEAFDTSRFFEDPFTSVRTTEWKYLENDSRSVLYDLPDEESDVSDTHPEVVAELSGFIDQEGIDWTERSEGEDADFDEATQEQLRNLGYLT